MLVVVVNCQPVSMWSEVHTMTSAENISLRKGRPSDSITVDPIIVHSETANISDGVPQDNHY